MNTIQGGKLTIHIDPDFRKTSMDTAAEWADYFEMDAKAKTAYLAEAERLCDIHDRIVGRFPEFNIFDYIPVTKSGHAAKEQTVLVADTTKSNLFNMEFHTKRLQLRLVPYYGDLNLLLSGKALEDAFEFKIDAFSNKTLTEPIFNKDGNPHKVEKARNAYLKDKDVVPGAVYADVKGTEYLYLGDLDIEQVGHKNGVIDADMVRWYKELRGLQVGTVDDIAMPTASELASRPACHCYLRMSKKLDAMAAGCQSLDGFIEAFLQTNSKGYKRWTEKLSMRENPRKFVSQARVLFADVAISPHWRTGPSEHDSYWGDISYKFRIVSVPFGTRKPA